MSSTGGTTNTKPTWEEISQWVVTFVSAAAPLAEAASPAAAAAIVLGSKILQGVVALEPGAVSLYEQITSGQAVTPAQMLAYSQAYESAYQQLNSDINAQLAKLPAA